MRTTLKLFTAGLVALSVPSLTSTVSAQEAAAPVQHYSVKTTLIGTLLDDPAAAKILESIIPTVYANDMFRTMGRGETLTGAQQYEPEGLSDENLAKIQAEFDKLAAAK